MGIYSVFFVEQFKDLQSFIAAEDAADPAVTDEDRVAVAFVRRYCEVFVEGTSKWLW